MFQTRSRACIAIIGATALLTLAGWASSTPAHASPLQQGDTSVEIAPASGQLACGVTMDVDVAINNVEKLFGVDIKVSYDPNILEVVDSNPTTPGVQVQQGDLPDVSGGQGLIQVNNVDAATGTVSYAAVRLNPAPAQSGSGTIATITFKGKGVGTSAVTIASAILADVTASQIEATTANGSFSSDCQGGPGQGGPGQGGPGQGGPGQGGPGQGGPGHGGPGNGGPGHGSGGGYDGRDGYGDGCSYVIKPGDSLYSIARMYGTSVSAKFITDVPW